MSHPTGRIVRAVTTIVGLADDGKPADAAVHVTCVLRHQAVRKCDLVFTRYNTLSATNPRNRSGT